jgi:hypothetical protein
LNAPHKWNIRKFKTYMAMDDLATIRPSIVLPAAGENFAFLATQRVEENFRQARSLYRASIGIGQKVDHAKITGETVKLDPAKVKDWLERSAPNALRRKKRKKGRTKR